MALKKRRIFATVSKEVESGWVGDPKYISILSCCKVKLVVSMG